MISEDDGIILKHHTDNNIHFYSGLRKHLKKQF